MFKKMTIAAAFLATCMTTASYAQTDQEKMSQDFTVGAMTTGYCEKIAPAFASLEKHGAIPVLMARAKAHEGDKKDQIMVLYNKTSNVLAIVRIDKTVDSLCLVAAFNEPVLFNGFQEQMNSITMK